MVAVAVGNEQFIGFAMHPHVGGLLQVERIGVAFARRGFADLHDEFAVLRELEQLIVAHRLQAGQRARGAVVAAYPYKTFVIDVDAMLAFGPFKARASATPTAQVVAGVVEDHDCGRGHFCAIA